jgi:hypothetical protein
VNEKRAAGRLERAQKRKDAPDRAFSDERARGQRDADRAPVEQCLDVARCRRVERDRAPHAERLAEREHPVVPGVEQRLRLGARQRLDAERARQAHERAVDPVGAQLGAAARRVVRRGVERGDGLAGEHELRALGRVAQERRRGAALERGEEGLGPEVLVNVEAGEKHGRGHNTHKSHRVYREYSDRS